MTEIRKLIAIAIQKNKIIIGPSSIGIIKVFFFFFFFNFIKSLASFVSEIMVELLKIFIVGSISVLEVKFSSPKNENNLTATTKVMSCEITFPLLF